VRSRLAWQAHGERAAHAERALHRQVTTNAARKVAADREPETSPFVRSCEVGAHLHERVDDGTKAMRPSRVPARIRAASGPPVGRRSDSWPQKTYEPDRHFANLQHPYTIRTRCRWRSSVTKPFINAILLHPVSLFPMTRLRLRLALALLTAAITLSDVAAAQTTDERDAIATVQKLFDAMRTRDTAAIRSLFVPNGRLFGMRTRPNGEVVLQSITADEFASFVARDTRALWVERAFNPEVRVRGSLATVWAEYDFHFGTQFSHCGVDAVQLLKVAERGWQIVSIADTFERQGCPSRPAPSL
jgi:hypothetical protein